MQFECSVQGMMLSYRSCISYIRLVPKRWLCYKAIKIVSHLEANSKWNNRRTSRPVLLSRSVISLKSKEKIELDLLFLPGDHQYTNYVPFEQEYSRFFFFKVAFR